MAYFRFSDGAGVPSQRDFNNVSSVSVNHGLGYIPQVWIVIDGELCSAEVTYNNTLTFTVIFNQTYSGVIYYR